MRKYKKYAFIYHFLRESRELKYESAQCEGDTEMRVVVKLLKWFSRRVDCCEIPGCDCRNNTMMINGEMIPEMKAAGVYENMTEIK
jgi:hypothetical protein